MKKNCESCEFYESIRFNHFCKRYPKRMSLKASLDMHELEEHSCGEWKSKYNIFQRIFRLFKKEN